MHWLRFLLFSLVLSGLLLAVNRHAYFWVKRIAPLGERARAGLIGVLVLAPLGVLFGRLLPGIQPDGAISGVLIVGGTLELALLFSVVLLLLGQGAHRLMRRARAGLSPKSSSSPAEDAVELSRRRFVTQAAAGSAFAIGGVAAGYGVLLGRHEYALEDVPVRLPGLSRKLDGFSIVQLSDLHIGAFVGEPELRAVEDIVRGARPDLIVLTGDLLDHDFRLADRLGAFTRRLAQIPRAGVVAISGNHDFYAGIAPIVRALRAGGARVLENAAEVVSSGDEGFALLGVADVWGPRFGAAGPDLERAIASLSRPGPFAARARELPRILLCHNPQYFEQAAGRVHLQLSGHTHGGQVNPLVRPADWVLPHGWVAGRYLHRDSQLYVNRGIGTVGPPARIGAPPEITRVILTA